MKNNKFVIEVLVLLAVIIDLGLPTGTKKDLTKSFTHNVNSSNHSSHEELHSLKSNVTPVQLTNKTKEANMTDLHHVGNSSNASDLKNVINTLHPQIGKSANMTPDPSQPSIPKTVVFAEGGIEVSTTAEYVRINSNETHKDTTKNIATIITTIQPNKIDAKGTNESKPITSGGDDKPIHKRIHGRPGVNNDNDNTTRSPPLHKKKPLFTMITEDKENIESESFIESPTTGRDYVLPIVLIILSLPIIGYIIKIIYRRGTEFTERQQYHRMYLIDGMYNSR